MDRPAVSHAFGRLIRLRQLLVKDMARPADARLFASAGVSLIAGRDSG